MHSVQRGRLAAVCRRLCGLKHRHRVGCMTGDARRDLVCERGGMMAAAQIAACIFASWPTAPGSSRRQATVVC